MWKQEPQDAVAHEWYKKTEAHMKDTIPAGERGNEMDEREVDEEAEEKDEWKVRWQGQTFTGVVLAELKWEVYSRLCSQLHKQYVNFDTLWPCNLLTIPSHVIILIQQDLLDFGSQTLKQ